ncbi:MAG: calcium-binding protein, partial [Actinobacteria bacterium]|nr:calcium-binding protein [Actinomycetota bacterium]
TMVLLSLLLGWVVLPPTASADSEIDLGIFGAADLEVDEARGRAYLSAGATVEIVDYSGNPLGSLTGLDDARGLAIVDDVLYVADHDTSTIERFDLSTWPHTRLEPFVLEAFTWPDRLVHAGGALWFTAESCGTNSQPVYRIELDGTGLTELAGFTEDSPYCLPMFASEDAPNRLVLGRETIVVYDLSTDPPTKLAERRGGVGSAVILPGGASLLRAEGLTVVELALDDLSGPNFTYQADRGMHLWMDFTPAGGGRILAVGSGSGIASIWLWEQGNATATRVIEVEADGNKFTAFSPDGESIWTFPGDGKLHVISVRPVCPGYELSALNQVQGTASADTLLGTPDPDVICGLGGNDRLIGLGGNDILVGGPGVDTLIGGPGADTLIGGPGADGTDVAADFGTVGLFGGPGNDVLLGGAGGDDLFGGGGNDRLVGADGEDILFGDLGKDTLLGGPALDILLGGAGNDTTNGGGGFDCADFEFEAGPITASLSSGTASGTGAGTDKLTGIECLIGSPKADHLTGNGAANTLWGLAGPDTLIGLAGNDFLHGWGGFDALNGGAGFDLCLVGANGGTRTGCEQTSLGPQGAAPAHAAGPPGRSEVLATAAALRLATGR